MARNLSAKKRREIKSRKLLDHHVGLTGVPVRELTLTELSDGERVFPETVYLAPLEPLAQGYPALSQTAVVMRHLELWGAEGARL